ncbi:MAG TPA: carboxymuconolactone decarboxylase family protein [Solirubrobacteraceae bacterium]|nr:carboxymuconolactone decarboxylase family protein [Solirubrobacteraceae bacterium]
MARLQPLSEPEWPEALRPQLGARPPGIGARLGDNNIFSTLARHPGLFEAWLPYGGFLLSRRAALPARERELLILRTGFNCGSSYEWGQHMRIGEALGMSREEVLRVAEGPDAPGWTAAERTLLIAADELHVESRLSDATWSLLAEDHDERGLIEIAMLVGHYHMVAFALNSLEVELDEGLEPLPRAGA